MRGIKFRSWHPTSKLMSIGFVLGYNYFGKVVDDTEGHPAILEAQDIARNELKIMQYTGLTDKNGKEIYEGDILSYSGEVAYEHAAYWGANTSWLHDIVFEIDEEIIGNIFENPELLK